MIMHITTFETLADPTRRLILAALRDGERPVGDIVKGAGVHQSGVSRHLKILSDAGFVSVRPEGQRRLYALRPEPFQELETWLADYRRVWEARIDRFGAALEARRTTDGGTGTSQP
jgi:DNA-binding transcriptional ArsR family regulator